MERNIAIDIIQSNLGNYLLRKGIDVNRKFVCLNPDHADHSPSMMFHRERNKCHCFSCGVDVNIFDIITWDYNLNNFSEALDTACDIFGIEIDNQKKKKHIQVKEIPLVYAKNEIKKQCIKASVDVCDKVYSNLKAVCPLTENDKKYLSEVRGLSNERIQKDYFRIQTEDAQRELVVNKLKKLTGYGKDVLKYVPGFFINKKTGILDYQCRDGIAILIRNVEGKAIGVQIRQDETSNKGLRYCWFTSSFAINRQDEYDGGSTPGAAKDILIPDSPKNCVCITEGRFKSEILAAMGNISISLQGVSTWKGIDEILTPLIEKYGIKTVFLMFDSDAMGNNQVLNSLKNLTLFIKDKFPELKTSAATWSMKYGKGIDDCILNGNIEHVRFLDALSYVNVCHSSYEKYLKDNGVRHAKNLSHDTQSKLYKELQEINENIIGL